MMQQSSRRGKALPQTVNKPNFDDQSKYKMLGGDIEIEDDSEEEFVNVAALY